MNEFIVISSFVSVLHVFLGFNLVLIGVCLGIIFTFLGISSSIGVPDLGVVILMLIVGSHIDSKSLIKHYRSSIAVVLYTVISTLICYFFIKSVLELSSFNSFIISGACCLSSTMVCTNELSKNNRVMNSYGQLSLIGTVVQDLFGILFIILARSKGKKMSMATVYAYLLLLLIFIIGVRYKKNIENVLFRIKEQYGNIGWAELIIFIFAGSFIFCEYVDHLYISKEIVFFIIGFLFRELIYSAENYLVPLQNISLTIVFIYAGMNMNNFSLIVLKSIAELVVFITIIRFSICYMLLKFINIETDTNVSASILLSSFSEILFFIVYFLNISQFARNTLIISTIISMIITPIIFNFVSNLFANFRRAQVGIAKYSARIHISSVESYTLIIGLNKNTKGLISCLSEKLILAFAIDSDLNKILLSNNKHCFFMDGRFAETYDSLDFKKINQIIIGVTNRKSLVSILNTIRSMNSKIPVYVLCSDNELIKIAVEYASEPVVLSGDVEEVLDEFVEKIYK